MIADTDSTPCPPTPARMMSYFTDEVLSGNRLSASAFGYGFRLSAFGYTRLEAQPDPEP